jgi:hypothetical protein
MYVTLLRGNIEQMENLSTFEAKVPKISFRKYCGKHIRNIKESTTAKHKGQEPKAALVEAD